MSVLSSYSLGNTVCICLVTIDYIHTYICVCVCMWGGMYLCIEIVVQASFPGQYTVSKEGRLLFSCFYLSGAYGTWRDLVSDLEKGPWKSTSP